MSERRDFPDWAVTRVYFLQEGACATCGAPLDSGFHKHHRDGDHANNEDTNLQLLCAECHHGLKFEHDKKEMSDVAVNLYETHRKVERAVMSGLKDMIKKGLAKELSGAAMERLMDGFTKMLQVSNRSLDRPMYPPAEIKIMLSKNIAEERLNEYIEGIKTGVSLMRINLVAKPGEEVVVFDVKTL